MVTFNINFDEELLEELVKKLSENVIKIHEGKEKTSKKYVRMYLVASDSYNSEEITKFYFGHAFNTLKKELASPFDLSVLSELKKVGELKRQGWKEEVFYK